MKKKVTIVVVIVLVIVLIAACVMWRIGGVETESEAADRIYREAGEEPGR